MAYINRNKIPAILRKGDKGDNAFIRYSANADGTDFTEEWSEGQSYIGFATGQTAPTDKSGYEWVALNVGEAKEAVERAEAAADRAEEIVTSLVTNTKTHLEGNGGTLDLEVEDGVIYHISGYNLINISAPSGADYTSHLFVSFANNGQAVGFQFPEGMKVYGANPSMVDGGDSWEVNVDNIGGALCMKKEVIT